MSRLFAVFALLLVVTLTFSACAPASPEPGEPEEEETREITVFYLDDPPFWKEQAERFTEATGIEVNWVGAPFGQLRDKELTAFATGDASYDVVHVRDDWVAEFGSRGFLLPLGDRVTSEMKEMSPDRAWENLMWDGTQYAVPRYFWMWQFYYNEEIFSEAGIEEPPQTWQEVAEMAGTLTADADGDGTVDQYGWCSAWGENLVDFPWFVRLLANGGELFDAEGEPAFNTEAGRQALQWMVDIAATDNHCPAAFELQHSGSLAELFAQGEVAMVAGTTQTYRLAEDPEASNVVGDVQAALMPAGSESTATLSETGSLAIPTASENADLAWEYIKFVTSVEEQKRMALELSSIPAVTEALMDPEVQAKYPHFQYVQEQMEHPFGMVKHPQAGEVRSALTRHILAALEGTESVEEALELAEEEIRAIGG